MSPVKTASKSASMNETVEKKRNISLTGLANFLNDQYAASEMSDVVRIKFKPVSSKASKKINLDAVSKVGVSKCPGLVEFLDAFNRSRNKETGKADTIEAIRKTIFDFDARATLDIVNEFKNFDKEDSDGNSILTAHLMRNLDLPHYRQIKPVQLCALIDRYFDEELYRIKLINMIYPHSVRDTTSEAKHGVNTVYHQHVPANTDIVLEMYTNGKSVEEIIRAVHKKIVDEADQMVRNVLKKPIIIDYVIAGKVSELKFNDVIDNKIGKRELPAEDKKKIKIHLRECLRELSRTTTLITTIAKGMEYNKYGYTDAAVFLAKFNEKAEQFKDFARTRNKYKRDLAKDFLAYFVDTILLCFDVFSIIEKDKKSDFVRQFIGVVDNKRRLRFNDKFRNDLVDDAFVASEFIQTHMIDAERLVGTSSYDSAGLSKFLNNFGKSCVNVKKEDRLTRSTYIAIALTVLRYLQTKIREILTEKVKSREITIYLTE